MKAELDANGTLAIRSESPLETFALAQWHELWEKRKTVFLVQMVYVDEKGSLGITMQPVENPK